MTIVEKVIKTLNKEGIKAEFCSPYFVTVDGKTSDIKTRMIVSSDICSIVDAIANLADAADDGADCTVFLNDVYETSQKNTKVVNQINPYKYIVRLAVFDHSKSVFVI